eukprot:gene12488-biopygen9047
MPAEYLDRDLPQAIMEYVRHIAVMRQWKWSTYAKNLSAIESALESLPLYTNQKKGIFLKECPEWRDNLLGAQLKERESVAQPPEPLTIDMYDKARKALEHRSRRRTVSDDAVDVRRTPRGHQPTPSPRRDHRPTTTAAPFRYN